MPHAGPADDRDRFGGLDHKSSAQIRTTSGCPAAMSALLPRFVSSDVDGARVVQLAVDLEDDSGVLAEVVDAADPLVAAEIDLSAQARDARCPP